MTCPVTFKRADCRSLLLRQDVALAGDWTAPAALVSGPWWAVDLPADAERVLRAVLTGATELTSPSARHSACHRAYTWRK